MFIKALFIFYHLLDRFTVASGITSIFGYFPHICNITGKNFIKLSRL